MVFDGALWYNLGMKKMILISLIAFLFAAPVAVAAVDDPSGTSLNSAESRAAQEEAFLNQRSEERAQVQAKYEASPEYNEAKREFDAADQSLARARSQYDKVSQAEQYALSEEARLTQLRDSGASDVQILNAEKAVDEAWKELEKVYSEAMDTPASQVLEAAQSRFDSAQSRLNDVQSEIDDGKPKVSILPATNLSVADCLAMLKQVNMKPDDAKEKFGAKDPAQRDDHYVRIILGCAVKTGDIKLWMVPYYVRYILEFVVQLGALAAVGGIVYGGYLYMFAGISEDKDRGKKAIMYSVGGIVIMAVAWAVVNVFISFFI